MVYASHEHQVDVGFALRERSTEMLGEPSESLGTCVFLSCDVCSRGSIFQHRNVGVIGLCETWVGAETFDFEVGESEALAFRNIHFGVEVDEVGR